MQQEDKSYAILKRMERQEHTETDLKEILQGIQVIVIKMIENTRIVN